MTIQTLTQNPLFERFDCVDISKEDIIFNQKDALPLDAIKMLEKNIIFYKKQADLVSKNDYFTQPQREKKLTEINFLITVLEFRINQLKKQIECKQ